MRYKTRRNLFVLFTLLFFISIVPIILYTQGFRLDTKNISLVKTGGLDLDVITSNSEVYLNNKFQRETNFLFRNAVFRNILPGEYNVEIRKPNYNTWQKTTLVQEGQVAKFPTIRLFPVELQEAVLMRSAQNVFLSNIGTFSILQVPTPATTDGEDTSQLIFYDLNVRLPIPLLTLQENETVRNVAWSASGVFSITVDSPLGPSIYTGTATQGEQLTDWGAFLDISYARAYNEETVVIPANSPNILYVFTLEADETYSLNVLELEQGIIRPNVATGMLGFVVVGEEVYHLDELGEIRRTNIPNRNTQDITPTAISKPGIVPSKVLVRSDRRAIAIINNESLFIWTESEPLEKIADGVLSASFSPDNNKLLYTTKNEAVVYWIEEIFGPPSRLVGDREILAFGGLTNAAWVGPESNHIAVQVEDEIIFTELDGRDTRNTTIYNIAVSNDVFKVDASTLEIYTIIDGSGFVSLSYE